MRYAALFLILGAGLIAAAIGQRGGWWIALWPACGALLVAGGYARLGAGVFGKRPDGGRALWAWLLHLPYMIITSIVWHIERWVLPENAVDHIADGVWVGRRPLWHEIPPAIAWVVDLTAEFWAARRTRAGRGYLCWPILDAHVCDDRSFIEAVRRIARLEGAIYIHCAQGHGRSAAVAAGVLIARGAAANLDEAERMLTRARPKIAMKPCQRGLVERVSAELAAGASMVHS